MLSVHLASHPEWAVTIETVTADAWAVTLRKTPPTSLIYRACTWWNVWFFCRRLCWCFLSSPAGVWAGRPERTDGQSRRTDEAAERHHRLCILTSATNRRKLRSSWGSRGTSRTEPRTCDFTDSLMSRVPLPPSGLLFHSHVHQQKPCDETTKKREKNKITCETHVKGSGFKKTEPAFDRRLLLMILSPVFFLYFLRFFLRSHRSFGRYKQAGDQKTGLRKWHTVFFRSVVPSFQKLFQNTRIVT